MKRTMLAAALAAVLVPAAAQDAPPPSGYAVQCGALVDVKAGRRLGPHTIVVRGNRIESVAAGRTAVDGLEALDLSAHTCTPG